MGGCWKSRPGCWPPMSAATCHSTLASRSAERACEPQHCTVGHLKCQIAASNSWRGGYGTRQSLIPAERIERLVLFLRGQKVILDKDLAELYGVATKRLNEQVRRNRARFPEDFMFQLTKAELEDWRSQIVTSNPKARMGLRRRP